MNTRFEIEQGIIAAIIYNDAFATVSSILQTKNFENTSHQKIFQTAASLYPLTPIDLITIYHELKKSNAEMATEIAQAMYTAGRYMVHMHLRYWCIMLLQLDITNAFERELILWRDCRLQDGQEVESAVLAEILEMVRIPSVDILELIEKSILYFDMQDMQHEYAQAKEFNAGVGKKAAGIRRTIALDTALSAAYKIADCDGETKRTCDKFIGAINTMIITNQVKPEFLQAAEIL